MAIDSQQSDHVVLDIEGMRCAGCAANVESALKGVPGVTAARVNLLMRRASVAIDLRRASAEDLVAAVKRRGYSATLAAEDDDLRAGFREREMEEAAAWRNRLAVGFVLLVPLLWLTYFSDLSPLLLLTWQVVLATPLQVYVGGPYFAGAWRSLRHGGTNMDTLVALGTGAAYLAGLTLWVRQVLGSAGSHAAMEGMYFADAAMILTFITLGKFLEAKSKGRASEAIRKLLDLAPPERAHACCVRRARRSLRAGPDRAVCGWRRKRAPWPSPRGISPG